METKTLEAYCALICGMVKHGQAVGAWEYFNEMLGINVKLDFPKSYCKYVFFPFFLIAEGFQPDIVTYNSILKIAGTVREDGEFIIQLIDVRISPELHNLIIFNFNNILFLLRKLL